MLKLTCKNCDSVLLGNFCSQCGQKAKTVPLNWDYVKDEVKYTFLHVNKGLFYTIKELYTRPGATIREFIEGKRIKHYKPILLVFVLAGISGYLSLKFDIMEMMKTLNQNNNFQLENSSRNANQIFMREYMKAMKWFFAHYAFMEFLALPFVSLASWLAFKKWGYNYIENIIINCFAAGQRLVFSILSLIVYLLVPMTYVTKISTITSIITIGLTVWTYITLYEKQDGGAVLLRILLFLFLMILFAVILLILFGFAFGFYLVKAGIIPVNNP